MFKTLCFTLSACIAGGAVAQSPARPDPADPKAAVPLRPYVSVFKDYRPYIEPEAPRWREANEEVGNLGGHVGHVPKSSGTAAKPAAKVPAQGGHGGHK